MDELLLCWERYVCTSTTGRLQGAMTLLFDAPDLAEVDPPAQVARIDEGVEVTWLVGDEPAPSHSWRASEVEVHAWESAGVYVEVALSSFQPQLVDHQQVRSSWLAVVRGLGNGRGRHARIWRRRVPVPPIRCLISQAPADLDGGGDSGEHLDAQTWDAGGMRVSIGTEDADALLSRVQGGQRLPAEWEGHLLARSSAARKPEIAHYPVEYERAGLTLRLPRLPRGAWFEVHLAAATATALTDDDVSTWYAVDVDPRRLDLPWLSSDPCV